MTAVGIDALAFFTPNTYVDLTDLAQARGDDPAKYTIGIGQDQMAVAPASQDLISMAANAAAQLPAGSLDDRLGLVIVGSESGVDESKAAAITVVRLLGLSPWLRAYDIKEACYGATAGLLAARDYVAAHPDRTALVIASDIARYGLAASGEVTQGAGAVAMLVSAAPRLLIVHDDAVAYTADLPDFFRPTGLTVPVVDGHYSTQAYLDFVTRITARHQEQYGDVLTDYTALLFHLPFTKMGKKALAALTADDRLEDRRQAASVLARRVGNIYTGSLYLSLLSLLCHDKSMRPGDRLGLFSYGSGAVGEFFSGTLAADFSDRIDAAGVTAMLAARHRLTVPEYEAMFNAQLPLGDAAATVPLGGDSARFTVGGRRDHARWYRDNTQHEGD
ncbi:hydroxymethylglutaryl-CoA synthase [Schleiferilactobacillus shenzhenensis]|uniref:Hydroxymethylglutaryl-CoA synthase n=1 Tax=Schleiferilactobacillus shenzhenensis LY-73 TaxID=1231336 RepID=U4TW92_9LACO|nr:hydroxymethylglutaryl-CoA synthase [Schleiferilactobacillus shenzhenensis]ERL66113.1 hydroxymethylglutaryl-CoA synthase [Schleiferilactobacillus shenzhenensis LY-73]